MTIRPGEPWGQPCDIDPSWMRASSDAGAVGAAPGPVVLGGGDLATALGGRGGPEPMRFTVDLIRVESDCGEHRAVAHVVARGRLWSGPTVVAMGGSHLGVWYLGPRAHPNDGLIDMTEGELGWRQRLIARRRAVTGTHVPHPALHQRRVRGARIDLARRRQLWIDGVRVGSTRWLAVTVQPDALTVVLPAAP